MNESAALVVHQSIDSTNEEAKRQLAVGAAMPLWIAAREQTQGRGRQGRIWSSKTGNLAASYITPIAGPPREAALFSFVSSLAVADTFESLAPGQAVGLKWPNDVLLNGCKASGILLESVGVPDQMSALVIGIGLNLTQHPSPEDANWPPTSILSETGLAPEFDQALDILVRAVEHRKSQFLQDGFASIRRDWLALAVNLGAPIKVRLVRETLYGRFAGLDVGGALLLEQASGQRSIAAGEVFFPEVA